MAADLVRASGLFVATAVAETLGCYLPSLWLRHGRLWDLIGVLVALLGMAIIVLGHARPS